MSNIITEGDTIRVPVNPDVYRDVDGNIFAKQGRPIWTIIKLELDDFYRDLIFTAEFKYKPSETNPLEQRHNSKVGIWLPVEDKVNKRDMSMFSEDYLIYDQRDTFAKLSGWTFGQRATIEITRGEVSEQSFSQELALCVCPWFLTAYKKGCELTLTLTGKKFGEINRYVPICDKKIRFDLDDDDSEYKENTEDMLLYFNDIRAFELSGKGNCVHPKQLYTIEGLKACLDRINHQSVEIAYIGTDTTENLRSVIRLLKSDRELSNKVKSLDIYYTKDWDRPLMDRFPDRLQINEKSSNYLFDLNHIEMPEDHSIPTNLKPVDIIISTYVTPWVLQSQTNLVQYESLIKNLMDKESSLLLTIDPSDSKYIIRDNLTNEAEKVQNFYLEELKLKANPINKRINRIADAVIWRKH